MDTRNQMAERYNRARELAENRKFDDAAALLEEVLAVDADSLRALDLLGYVEYFRGFPDRGENCCRRALAIDPDHVYALKGLGLCLAAQGQVDEGVRSLERAIALNPAWPDARWDLAVVLIRANRPMAAIEVLRRAAMDIPHMMERFTRLMQQAQAKLKS